MFLKDQTCAVMRGSWFIDESWDPIDEAYANEIESAHLTKFEHQKCEEEESTEVTKGPVPGRSQG